MLDLQEEYRGGIINERLNQYNNEKLPEIPEPKQAVHCNYGGGVECIVGICDNYELPSMATD